MSEINTNGRNWYTVKEFAMLVKLSKQQVYKLGDRGVVKIIKTVYGKSVPKSEYERYLENGLSDTIKTV